MNDITNKRITVMVRPVNYCNLSCNYCYTHRRKDKKMDREVLLKIIESAFLTEYKHIKFLWHGGEPLLAGIKFFRDAINIQNSLKKEYHRIYNEIQTNATLLNQEYINFIKRHSFHIGISLDGPQQLNDSNRYYSNGLGSYTDVVNGINLLKKNDIDFGGIAVLDKSNSKYISQIYDTYKSLGLSSLKANPCIYNKNSVTSKSPREVGNAYKELFDIWTSDLKPLRKVRPLYEMIQGLFVGHTDDCSYSGKCAKNFIAFDSNGDAYPCNRFIGVKEFHLGNIQEHSITDMMQLDSHQIISQRFEHISECKRCPIGHLCNSGCSYSAYMHTGSLFRKDYYCETRLIIYDYIAKKVAENISIGDLNES